MKSLARRLFNIFYQKANNGGEVSLEDIEKILREVFDDNDLSWGNDVHK
jgi:hypothetical protein